MLTTIHSRRVGERRDLLLVEILRLDKETGRNAEKGLGQSFASSRTGITMDFHYAMYSILTFGDLSLSLFFSRALSNCSKNLLICNSSVLEMCEGRRGLDIEHLSVCVGW